jgi:hypothetical protein
MPVIPDDNNLLIRCTCHGHVLDVEYDDYEWANAKNEDDLPEPVFYVSVWNQTPSPFSFWNRLQMIWGLIRGKNLNGGDVIIELSDAREIVNFLNKKLGESK